MVAAEQMTASMMAKDIQQQKTPTAFGFRLYEQEPSTSCMLFPLPICRGLMDAVESESALCTLCVSTSLPAIMMVATQCVLEQALMRIVNGRLNVPGAAYRVSVIRTAIGMHL